MGRKVGTHGRVTTRKETQLRQRLSTTKAKKAQRQRGLDRPTFQVAGRLVDLLTARIRHDHGWYATKKVEIPRTCGPTFFLCFSCTSGNASPKDSSLW